MMSAFSSSSGKVLLEIHLLIPLAIGGLSPYSVILIPFVSAPEFLLQ